MAPGNTFAVLQGIGYWAPLGGAAIPGPHLAYGDPMPTGWNPIVDTVSGYQVTYRNPRAAITSEERGRIGQVPAGDEGVACALQYRSIEFDLLKLISALQSRTLAARTQVSTLTITSGADTTGNVLVDPGGLASPVSVAVLDTDATADAIATKIRAASFTGWVTGGTGAVVTFTASADGYQSPASYDDNGTNALGGMVITTPGINETEVAELDKNVEMGFMLSIEGIATAGSFFENRRWIRYVFYNVENTANADHVIRHSGADAAFAPSATLEGLPALEYSSAMLLNTGLTAADLDPNRRSNFFAIDAPEVP